MMKSPKELAIEYVQALKAERYAQRNLDRAMRELERATEKRESADQTLRKIANDGLMKERDIAVKDGSDLYMLNILSDGISVKNVDVAEIPQPKPEAVQMA